MQKIRWFTAIMKRRVGKMTKGKYSVRVLVLWLTVFFMSFCSQITCSAAAVADPQETVIQASQKLQNLKNYHMTLGVTNSMKVQGKNISIGMNGEWDVQVKPMLMKNTMTMTTTTDLKKSEQTMLQYFEQVGDQLFLYLNVNNQWVKQSVPNYNPLSNYDIYLKMIKSVTLIRETPDSKVYEVTVDGSYLQDNFEQIMASTGMKNVKLPADLLKGVGDFKYNLFIDSNTGLISEMYMDMSDFMRTIGNNMADSANMSEGPKTALREMFNSAKLVIAISFSQFNSVEKIQIPQEARAGAASIATQPKQPDSSPPPSPSQVIPSDANMKATVKIGCNLELTGGVAQFGQEALNGARLAVKEANDSGGVLGRQIELIERDNASEPSQSVAVMATLVSQDKVVAVIGAVASSDSLSAAPVAEGSRIPMISPTSTNPRVTMEQGQLRRYVFRACFIDPYQGKIMAEFASGSLGAKTAAIITDSSSDYSRSISQVFQSNFVANGGKIAAQETYRQKDEDFSGQVTRIQEANPDVVFIPGYYQEAGRFIRQAREMGITVPLLGADGWDSPGLLQTAGAEALNNTYFSNHYSQQDGSPAGKRFADNYRREYKTGPSAISALGYDAALMVLEAIKKANSTEPEKIRTALETIEVEGATGKISFDVFHNPVKPAVVIQMVNGRQTLFQRINP